MTNEEVGFALEHLAEAMDGSNRQQAVKGIVLSMLGAWCAHEEMNLLNHVCEFSRAQITALEGMAQPPVEWPDEIS